MTGTPPSYFSNVCSRSVGNFSEWCRAEYGTVGQLDMDAFAPKIAKTFALYSAYMYVLYNALHVWAHFIS